MNGIITKLIGGLYTVIDEQNTSHVVKPRGKFRHTKNSPKVGDYVVFDEDFITEIKPRKNELVRPPLANIDQAFIITSAKQPDFSYNLLDRFLVLIEHEDITPIIVVTKIDLCSPKELEELKRGLAYYQKMYDVIYVSNKTFEGIEQFKELFKSKVNVFSGQTGAGKSSLLNSLNPDFELETNIISKALGRGKHTTRHSELHPLFGGLVADTPGFSKLDFYDITVEEVSHCFIDFFELSDDCKFRGCMHLDEPKCSVKKHVEDGTILPQRYADYQSIVKEISEQKVKY